MSRRISCLTVLGLAVLVGSVLALGACGADEQQQMSSTTDAGPRSDGPIICVPEAGPTVSADGPAAPDPTQPPPEPGKLIENDFVDTSVEPTSTFGIDVDTGSYTLMRGEVNAGRLPAPDSVRVEEFINYFDYAYPQPTDPAQAPFTVNLDLAPSEFGDAGAQLLRIGLKGYEVPPSERLPANLVFLVDVSGSMSASNKMPLVKQLLTSLTQKLQPSDTLAIVTYSSLIETLLPPTPVSSTAPILAAIAQLMPGGGTAGGPGLQAAYTVAEQGFKPDGINRIVICTDGDFNLGLAGEPLIQLIESYRDTKDITLSVFGFGMYGYGVGNYQDAFLEQLADKGNGNYAYIDSADEIARVVEKKLVAILQMIAKDVKVQVSFDPQVVKAYRLVGYENRVMNNQDFGDDKKDGGEIGAGHAVTAFYELKLQPTPALTGEVAKVSLRFKTPKSDTSRLIEYGIDLAQAASSFVTASSDLRFAAAVAELAEILRRSKHSQGARFADVAAIVSATAGKDPDRLELLALLAKIQALWTP